MEGDLGELIEALDTHYQAEKLNSA